MSWIEVDQFGRPRDVSRTVSNTSAHHGHCVACGHALTLHGRAVGGCVLCACDAAVEDRNAANAQAPVNLQSGDSVDFTHTIAFDDVEKFNHAVRGKPLTFEDLIERIQELTGLNPRRASVVAAEIAELGGVTAGGEFQPLDPPDHLIVGKAKEAGYLPDNWRLP